MAKIVQMKYGPVEMTADKVRRTRQALNETLALLSRELQYSPDLRKQDVIAGYKAHIATLEGYLAAAR